MDGWVVHLDYNISSGLSSEIILQPDQDQDPSLTINGKMANLGGYTKTVVNSYITFGALLMCQCMLP